MMLRNQDQQHEAGYAKLSKEPLESCKPVELTGHRRRANTVRIDGNVEYVIGKEERAHRV